MDQLQVEAAFLDQRQNDNRENNNTCNRVIRKKFRCIILFMLTVIATSQLLIIFFEKVDEKYINQLLNKFISKNITF
jgi:hypothetical protein